MLCSWCICSFSCLVVHYCEASHFGLQNYTFFEYFGMECQASHWNDHVLGCNYLHVNSECVQFEQKHRESNPGIARPRNVLQKKAH